MPGASTSMVCSDGIEGGAVVCGGFQHQHLRCVGSMPSPEVLQIIGMGPVFGEQQLNTVMTTDLQHHAAPHRLHTRFMGPSRTKSPHE